MRATLLMTMSLWLALGGCGVFATSREARTPALDVHHLRVGMDAGVLRDRIGSPDAVADEPDGSQRWTYRYGDDPRLGRSSLVVHVRDGQVRTWEERLGE